MQGASRARAGPGWLGSCMLHRCLNTRTACSLPLALTLPTRPLQILCMHGGLSPELKSLEQIKRVARPTDVPDSGLLCDLLWADPDKDIQVGAWATWVPAGSRFPRTKGGQLLSGRSPCWPRVFSNALAAAHGGWFVSL